MPQSTDFILFRSKIPFGAADDFRVSLIPKDAAVLAPRGNYIDSISPLVSDLPLENRVSLRHCLSPIPRILGSGA
jgi:hypothetical protein